MKDRKGFTLIELLVVIGILAILMGILLPVLSKIQRTSKITAEKADLQTISTALEQYKTDFGDYPRNVVLPTWNTLPPGALPATSSGLGPAPIHLSLAAALIGAGPGITQTTNSGIYEVGDGADGLGFRAQQVSAPVTVTALSIGTAPSTVTINVDNNDIQALNNFRAGQMSLTMSSGLYYEETVGVSGVGPITATVTLTLAAQPIYSIHQPSPSETYILKVATGKNWPNYLSADTFKVAFIPTAAVSGIAAFGGPPGPNTVTNPAGETVLLDRWGQVIQYFPRYGPASNRTNDSISFRSGTTPKPDSTVIAGPLYGYSQPWSLERDLATANGQNALFDFRDGTPYIKDPSSASQPNMAWGDITVAGNFFYPEYAIRWMLGDQPDPTTGNPPDNVIRAPEKLSTDGPYILISAGPNGQYCNMVDPNTGNPLPANAWQTQFNTSGNIYNFDRP